MLSIKGFTPQVKADLRKYKLTPETLTLCDLILHGWNEMDAFRVCGLFDQSLSDSANATELARLRSTKPISDYLALKRWQSGEDRIPQSEGGTYISDEEIAQQTSKQEQIRKLVAAQKEYSPGSKEWLDMAKLIADLTQAKKEEIITDEDIVHYYLPLQCRANICPFLEYYESVFGKQKV